MPYDNLRQLMGKLKEEGELHEVNVEVDPAGEVGAICREILNREGPALVFNKVKGYQTPLVAGIFGTLKRYALALEVPNSIHAIREKWNSAYSNPIKPRVVTDAACKAVKKTDIDLYADPFPIPKWHDLDSNPYLGTFHAVITKDPETGWTNVGNYRNELKSKNTLGCLMIPYRHIGLHWEKWRKLGKPMPIAIALGLEPYLSLVSVSGVPAQVDEYDIAGGLKGRPIDVVRAETSDLLVPANASIVIEGEAPIDDFLPTEGPFGEFAGYMGEAVFNCQYMKVTCVTHAENPVFQGTYEGRPPNESTVTRSVGRSLALYQHLVTNVGLTGIVDVCVTMGGCSGFHAVVAIEKSYPGHVRDVMANVWGHPNLFCKHCIVVDADIDPWNPTQVEWAIATSVKASRDIELVKEGKSLLVDPSSPRPGGGERGAVTSDLLGIDATRPLHVYAAAGQQHPVLESPPKGWPEKVKQRWLEYGFAG